MKKLIAILLTMVMALTLLAGCANQPADGTTPGTGAAKGNIDTSKLNLISDGVLTVGSQISYPPFEMYAEDGVTPIGYDMDLAAAIADKLGLEVNYVDTAWDGIFEGIGVNYDVVISGVTINAKRMQTMSFSTPYVANYQAVVVPANSDLTFGALTDLSGYSVAMQKETTSDLLLDELIGTGSVTDCAPVTNESVTTCFEQLTNGEVDVVLCDSTVADGYVASSPELYKIAYLDEAEHEEFGVAIGKDDAAMVEAVNAAIAELEAEGYMDALYTKWFG